MNNGRIQELAHGLAFGELSSVEEQEFFCLLPAADDATRKSLKNIFDASGMVSTRMPVELPPASLKQRVLGSILSKPAQAEAAKSDFQFVYDDGKGWQELPVKGAFVKPLSLDPAKPYAVVLGKLMPGARYPAHRHTGPEEVYVISGDLTIGSTRMKAGDFHHADPGSEHPINYSEEGCIVLVVLTIRDLEAQYAAAEEIARS